MRDCLLHCGRGCSFRCMRHRRAWRPEPDRAAKGRAPERNALPARYLLTLPVRHHTQTYHGSRREAPPASWQCICAHKLGVRPNRETQAAWRPEQAGCASLLTLPPSLLALQHSQHCQLAWASSLLGLRGRPGTWRPKQRRLQRSLGPRLRACGGQQPGAVSEGGAVSLRSLEGLR